MSSSRRALRLRRHKRYGKPSYPARPANGRHASYVIIDEVSEWVNPYYPSLGEAFMKSEERIRKFWTPILVK